MRCAPTMLRCNRARRRARRARRSLSGKVARTIDTGDSPGCGAESPTSGVANKRTAIRGFLEVVSCGIYYPRPLARPPSVRRRARSRRARWILREICRRDDSIWGGKTPPSRAWKSKTLYLFVFYVVVFCFILSYCFSYCFIIKCYMSSRHVLIKMLCKLEKGKQNNGEAAAVSVKSFLFFHRGTDNLLQKFLNGRSKICP